MKAFRCHRRWIVAACLGVLPACAVAQLSDSSPFAPTGAPGGPGAAAENEPLELHGIMATPDGLRFCIYDAAKRTSRWVGLNESGNGTRFVVKSADPDRDTVSIQSDGRIMTLALQKAKVASSGPLPIWGLGGGGLPGNVVLNPSPADDQRRLQAVAEEVRRRRLLRERADQQAGQPGLGAVNR